VAFLPALLGLDCLGRTPLTTKAGPGLSTAGLDDGSTGHDQQPALIAIDDHLWRCIVLAQIYSIGYLEMDGAGPILSAFSCV